MQAPRLTTQPGLRPGLGPELQPKLARLAAFAVLSALALYLAATLGAGDALAQAGRYQDNPINRTGINVRDAILGMAFVAGGIGVGLGILLKGVGGPSKTLQNAGNIALMCGVIAVILSAVAIPALQFVQGLGAGG